MKPKIRSMLHHITIADFELCFSEAVRYLCLDLVANVVSEARVYFNMEEQFYCCPMWVSFTVGSRLRWLFLEAGTFPAGSTFLLVQSPFDSAISDRFVWQRVVDKDILVFAHVPRLERFTNSFMEDFLYVMLACCLFLLRKGLVASTLT